MFVLITTAYIGENLANKCYLSSAIDVHQCQSAEYLAAHGVKMCHPLPPEIGQKMTMRF